MPAALNDGGQQEQGENDQNADAETRKGEVLP